MIVYVGAGSGPFRWLVIQAGHGQMVSPQVGAFRIPEYGRWAFDNGAYTDYLHGEVFDDALYAQRLQEISTLPDNRLPDWCVVPDIVADPTSLAYSLRWRQALHGVDRRLKWYLAIQDFMTPEDVLHAMCLEPFDGLFIGGSTKWKWETASKWVQWGHDHGLPVHLARVNGPGPLQRAVDMGADSIDGTGWVRAGAAWYPALKDVPLPHKTLFAKETPEIPEHWLKFGQYLQGIWSERDWKRWAKEGLPIVEEAQSVDAMSPEDFLQWLESSYLPKAQDETRRMIAANYLNEASKVPSFSGPGEIALWKRFILWELERILIVPAPPAPELPRFVIVSGKALPLPEGLKRTKGVLEKCEATGGEMVVVRGPSGEIHVSYPVVKAVSAARALSKVP